MSKKTVSRFLNGAAIALIILIVAAHTPFVWRASTNAQTWEDRVFVIERQWHYQLLNPLARGAIGFTIPLLSIGYVSQAAADKVGTDVIGVQRHEAKHLEQVNELGLLQYYQLARWKREGVAEYVRGKPTIGICAPDEDENANRVAYRQFYVTVRYLVEVKNLSESEIYQYEGYPLAQAEAWLAQTACA